MQLRLLKQIQCTWNNKLVSLCRDLIRIRMAVEFTAQNFNDEVINSDKPVLVDFWAEWCGPCKMIGPVVKELAADYDGKAVIGKVNVDENPTTAAQFGIRSIPTLMLFKDGAVHAQKLGAMSKSQLTEFLESNL